MQAQREITSSGEDVWAPWPVNWTAVWIGALAALAAALIFSLIGTAAGAQAMKSVVSWKTISIVTIAATICAAFFAFVIGGWVAGKIAGPRHAEPAILHATIAWLVALPLLVAASSAGAGGIFSPLVAVPASPDAIRNTALAALLSLLVGLIGSVIGGWMASGEPMTLTHYRTRRPIYAPRREF
jgi:hypothetical protein